MLTFSSYFKFFTIKKKYYTARQGTKKSESVSMNFQKTQ